MRIITTPGGHYHPAQFIRDCILITDTLGDRKQRGFYTVGFFSDHEIEIENGSLDPVTSIRVREVFRGGAEANLSDHPDLKAVAEVLSRFRPRTLQHFLHLAVRSDEVHRARYGRYPR